MKLLRIYLMILKLNIAPILAKARFFLSKKKFYENPSLELRKLADNFDQLADKESNLALQYKLREKAKKFREISDNLDNLGVIALSFFPDEGTD